MESFGQKKKYKLKGKVITVILCVVCLTVGIVVGTKIPSRNDKEDKSTFISQIVEFLDKNWVDTTDSKEDMQTRMITGLIDNLGDPYTNYMTMEQVDSFIDAINGDFVGVGVSFIAVDDGGMVLKVFKDTPASLAGIKAGDILYQADGKSLAGKNADEIKKLVVGEAGSSVKLSVLRGSEKLTFNIVRKAVETDVEYEIKKDYGYLNITTFGDSTASHVESVLKEFENRNIKKIVIDLRDNSGGYLNAVEGILNLFIPNNQVMFKMQDNTKEILEYKADNEKIYSFDQGYILMNSGSASSSEVMIGALTEILNYKTIGEKSFGKGIAQSQVTLSNGSTLKYTNARWLTPSGKCIQGVGFTPDYKVEEDNITNYTYRQFDKKYQYDSVSVDVALMQKMLKKLGYHIDRVDGFFSKKSEEALKKFQSSIHVKSDGVYTISTAKRLYGAVAVEIYQKSEDKVLDKAIELMK